MPEVKKHQRNTDELFSTGNKLGVKVSRQKLRKKKLSQIINKTFPVPRFLWNLETLVLSEINPVDTYKWIFYYRFCNLPWKKMFADSFDGGVSMDKAVNIQYFLYVFRTSWSL